MNWLKHWWRQTIAELTMRVGPKQRPLGEVYAYAYGLFAAAFYLMIRLYYVISVS